MSALDGPIRARWFDPTTGNYIAISNGYVCENRRTRRFNTPGKRGDGTDDWVLVLDSTGSPRCGTITTSGRYTAPRVAPTRRSVRDHATSTGDPSVIARARVTFTRGS